MSLALRPYHPSDAAVITSWLKASILCANGAPTDMSIILSRHKI